METAAAVVVGVLFLLGLIGAFLPFVPGPLFILAGAVMWAAVTGFTTLGVGRLGTLAALAALTFAVNLVAGAVGARRSGATRWGVAGAIVGALVGVFLGPVGLVLGPIAGAVAGELLRGATLEAGMRAGLGALLGFLAGLVADFAVGLVMIGLFLYWVWWP